MIDVNGLSPLMISNSLNWYYVQSFTVIPNFCYLYILAWDRAELYRIDLCLIKYKLLWLPMVNEEAAIYHIAELVGGLRGGGLPCSKCQWFESAYDRQLT
jgi:hypothetical protein